MEVFCMLIYKTFNFSPNLMNIYCTKLRNLVKPTRCMAILESARQMHGLTNDHKFYI